MSEELTPVSAENLTPEEKERVTSIAEKIDVKNTAALLQYGAEPQKKIAEFSESALSAVRTKELGEVGDMLTSLVSELKSLDTEKDGFFGKLFKKTSAKISVLKSR